MSGPLPEGFVDPTDRATVATITTATLRSLGWPAVLDLLRTAPGVEVVTGRPRRLLSPPIPSQVSTPEGLLILTEPPQVHHVVAGIVLSRATLTPGEVAGLIADTIALACARHGRVDRVSVALTALRDTVGG